MNDLTELYFTMKTYLFPMPEEEIGEFAAKMKEGDFIRLFETNASRLA